MRAALILGAVLLILGVAGRIIVPEHAPYVKTVFVLSPRHGWHWSRTAYDAARIGSWAALIVGAILALFGLSISVRGSRLT